MTAITSRQLLFSVAQPEIELNGLRIFECLILHTANYDSTKLCLAYFDCYPGNRSG